MQTNTTTTTASGPRERLSSLLLKIFVKVLRQFWDFPSSSSHPLLFSWSRLLLNPLHFTAPDHYQFPSHTCSQPELSEPGYLSQSLTYQYAFSSVNGPPHTRPPRSRSKGPAHSVPTSHAEPLACLHSWSSRDIGRLSLSLLRFTASNIINTKLLIPKGFASSDTVVPSKSSSSRNNDNNKTKLIFVVKVLTSVSTNCTFLILFCIYKLSIFTLQDDTDAFPQFIDE